MDNKSKFQRFRIFDQFGAKPTFNINGNSVSTSIFGGICYLIFFICSLAYVLNNLFDFFFRKNVNLNFSQNLSSPAPRLNLSYFKFNISLRISDSSNIITPQIFDKHFNLEFRLISYKNNKSVTMLNLRKCRKDDFDDLYTDLKYISEYSCAIYENISEYYIEGTYQNRFYHYLEISISFKDQTLSKYSYIKEYLSKSNLKVSLLTSECKLDFENYTEPISFSHNSLANYIEFDIYKRVDVKISQVQFHDDINWFISSPYENTYFTTDTIRDYSSSRNNKTELFSIFLSSSRNVYVFKRIYQKLPDFIANMTGILGQVVLILWFLIAPINEKHLSQTILNKVMKYDIVTNNKIDKHKDIFSRDINSNYTYSFNNINKSNINLSRIVIKDKLDIRDKIRLSSCDLFSARFCCCLNSKHTKKKLDVINKCEDKISFYLNVLVYIRKMQELDIIKFLLFNTDHFRIFNFLASPSVLMNDNSNNIYEQFRNQQKEIEVNINKNVFGDIIRSFEFLKKRDNNDDITNKLLNLFIDEVEHFSNQN